MFQITKDPNAVLDYYFDWSTWLNGDTIATSTWIVPAGLTMASESETSTRTTIWLSAGIFPERYKVVNRITTAAGRTEDRTLLVIMEEN